MDAYSNVVDTSYTNSKTIGDYEFFPSDVNNFINVGLIFDAVTQGHAAEMIQSSILIGEYSLLIFLNNT